METPSALSLQALAQRMATCVARAGGKRALADACLISESQVYRYLSGENIPTADRLIAIAQAAGVRPEWLLTGEGTPDAPATPIHAEPAFLPELLLHITQLVEELLLEHQKHIPPLSKAQILSLTYEAARTEGLRRQDIFLPEKGLVFSYLTFFGKMMVGDDLELYTTLFHTLLKENPLSPQQALQFERLATNGNAALYTGVLGERYFERMGYVLSPETTKRMLAQVEELTRKAEGRSIKWLDMGCGNGRHLAFLNAHCPQVDAYGVDTSPLAVHLCEQLVRSQKLRPGKVEEADMRHLPYAESTFDALFSRMGLYSLPYIPTEMVGTRLFFAEAQRVLKPGGVLHITSLHGEGRCYAPFVQYHTRQSITEAGKEFGFEVETFTQEENPSDNGGRRGLDYSSFYQGAFHATLKLKGK